jgi:predicted nucleic acid-binding protein
MRVFLDANILVSVVNKEYPAFTYTARILSMADDNKGVTLVTTNICLAIVYYFATKKHGHKGAKDRVSVLVQHLDIAECGKKEALCVSQNKKIYDFEDGLQYYAALHDKCTCIVTNDLEDFYFSDLEVLDAERFFNKYV